VGWEYVLEKVGKGAITEDCHEGIEPGLICVPLEIEVTWPSAVTYIVTMLPKFYSSATGEGSSTDLPMVGVYSIDVSSDELPFSDYEVVVILDREAWVVPSNETKLYGKLEQKYKSHRDLSIDAKEFARPRSWNSLVPHLAKYGFRQHPLSLSPDEPALKKLAAEADPRGLTVQVFGMQMGIGLFLSAVGIILGALAFGMIGPLLALRGEGRTKVSHPWIMIIPTRPGMGRGILEVTISLISIAWIIAPLVLAQRQFSMRSEFLGLEGLALKIGFIGLLFSGLAHLLVSLQLRALRRYDAVIGEEEEG
jgi:hypothetical protein